MVIKKLLLRTTTIIVQHDKETKDNTGNIFAMQKTKCGWRKCLQMMFEDRKQKWENNKNLKRDQRSQVQ